MLVSFLVLALANLGVRWVVEMLILWKVQGRPSVDAAGLADIQVPSLGERGGERGDKQVSWIKSCKCYQSFLFLEETD